MTRTQKDWANHGEAHHNWVKDPGYETRHDRLRRKRGQARKHPCTDCKGPAIEWSQIHGTDGLDVWNDYVPRCKKCHHAYDRPNWDEGIANRDTSGISQAATQTNKKRWQDPSHRAKMSAAVAASNRRRAEAKRRAI